MGFYKIGRWKNLSCITTYTQQRTEEILKEKMSQFAERRIAIHAVWRGETELMAHVYAWNINFGGTGHHYTGPFRSVVELYDFYESRQHCSQSLWRWVYRYPNFERRELANEAEMVIAGMRILYQ